ncbi:long-chain fatty acid--CoA ligase [Neiella marina]|uniref:Long-chain fatty acid--CoA ligase n=1 Tax=Neiella holothuriorum TaxID=2870530 RepID=A0ABS7EKJ7_9GAMM|nr:long-chain fatty acid--CoA ligase [Neiella holothuriorum]MBW8192859.1 long-chain fatty acid--CoA ligase [Neiella holothuriorum]
MTSYHLVELLRERISQSGDSEAMRFEQNGSWQSINWNQVGEQVQLFAKALIHAGHFEGDKVGIFSRNMPEWTFADYGILAARGVVVPVYPTNTLEQARYIVRDAGIHILCVGEQEQYELAKTLLAQGEISRIVVFDAGVDISDCRSSVYYHDFTATGDEASATELQARRERCQMTDLVTLIYTSGTTGDPKGVMLDFNNFAAAMKLHDERIELNENDVSLCMLPLSHVYERGWTFFALFRGATNVYLRDPSRVMDVIEQVKPSVMCAVPRLYEKAYAMIHSRVSQAPKIRQLIFKWASKVGLERLQQQQDGQQESWLLAQKYKLADKLVFAKLRGRFGGNCRFFPVGGAGLDQDVHRFFLAAGMHLKLGYGMTETTATVSCFKDQGYRLGTVGTPMPGVEVKLGPDNEIWVKGDTVMRGYYNKPEATAETITTDGWLRTGDAGYVNEQGDLVFTERLKELMKTSNGKYVAPQLVENTIGKDRFIEQIAVVADARNFVSALIVPCFETLEEYAKALNLAYQERMELVRHPQIMAMFQERLESLQQSLARYEQVKRFTLLTTPFSMELGEITPTLKLRRKVIESKYQQEIDAMYAPAH